MKMKKDYIMFWICVICLAISIVGVSFMSPLVIVAGLVGFVIIFFTSNFWKPKAGVRENYGII